MATIKTFEDLHICLLAKEYADELTREIGGFNKYLKQTAYKGQKYIERKTQ